ncbi:hypothetical protein L3081_24105 [Colwellia sp. MSW7]|uniref:Uncharacterized protein n=1 Tax=Colwellia maritima TaxID=2912588 RepID=A0ABS9X7Z9_9GAMM|nr:hypothetical protein [Colwellia maritima]MCI2285912.1 hypothetical protein [Colwellia maritima]
MQSQRLLYQDNYGSLKSTALIEFVTPNELLSLFELIAPQFNATSELLINNRGNPYIVFNLNKEHRVVIKSINPRWSEEMASDKFVLLTRICEKGLLTFKDINALNRDNVDVKFTAYTPKGEKETYLGVDKLMGLVVV